MRESNKGAASTRCISCRSRLLAVLLCTMCDRYSRRKPTPDVALLALCNRPEANVAERAPHKDRCSSFPKLFPAVRRLGVKRVRWQMKQFHSHAIRIVDVG
jgi:hypothetical protein